MFFFFFDEPRQINDLSVQSLSQFVNLLERNGQLSLNVREMYYDLQADRFDDGDGSYRMFIAQQENENKMRFAHEMELMANRKDGENLNPKYKVFYRGISDSSFLPIPSVYRGNNFKYEDVFIEEIRISNPDFVKEKTYVDELSALQHYGCPTRLLDLTNNPLVALYFACEGGEDTDGTVLLFLAEENAILHSNSDKVLILTAMSHLSKSHKDQLLNICDSEIKAKGIKRAILNRGLARKASVRKLYQEITRVSPFEKEIACFDLLQSFYVQPAFTNLRIRAQHGLFLINGLCANQKECASRNENKIFAKVRVPAALKKRILGELDSVGVNRKTLFPEIEDTIKYLRERYK